MIHRLSAVEDEVLFVDEHVASEKGSDATLYHGVPAAHLEHLLGQHKLDQKSLGDSKLFLGFTITRQHPGEYPPLDVAR